jgi:hypothetical protein
VRTIFAFESHPLFSSLRMRKVTLLSSIIVVLVLLGLSTRGGAQSIPAQARISASIDQTALTRLPGNRHPLARAEFDQGHVDASTPMRVTMFFKMTAAQQAGLDALIAAQQNRSSADYQRWLTPEQFGNRFGLGQSDIDKLTAWLESAGFQVQGVPASRNMITFSGTAQQLEAALHTEIHRYNVRGEAHYANASDPSIPSALSDVTLGFRGLNDFRLKPHLSRRTVLSPKFTTGVTGNHYIAPGDLATIYDLQALYSEGLDGTGQKIVVVGQSDVALSDIQNFRKAAGLPANDPTPINVKNSSFVGLVVPGDTDPGMQSLDIDEANLDVEWAGATAPKAKVIFIVGGVAKGEGGVFDALVYAITTSPVPAPVISISYGACEQDWGTSGVSALTTLGQQASTEGITILAATGDTGAADCDFNFGPPNPTTVSSLGLAVDLPAALTTVTAVGGSEFNEGTGTYWTPALATDVVASALSYIPETAWNETNNTTFGGSTGLTAGGGGSSAFIPKPGWQAVTGMPNDGARDLPDISLSASPFHDAYLICSENFDSTTKTFSPTCPTSGSFRNTDGSLTPVGGTSLGPPVLAGIVALINQETHPSGSGNINPVLYSLATQVPTAFHDVSRGNNQVPFSTSCAATTQIGYIAGTGYDLATGLGSIDAFVMVTNWSSVVAATPANATLVDFSLAFSPTQVTVKKGACGTAQVLLTPLHGFSGVPSFTCKVSSTLGSTTCAVVPVPVLSSLLMPGTLFRPDWHLPAGIIVIVLLVCCVMVFGLSTLTAGQRAWRWTNVTPVSSLFLLCVVCLSCGGGTSNNDNSVRAVVMAPSVTAQPTDQTVVQGQSATFSVSASGTAPLSYQWMKNGTTIRGATASSYTTPATTASDQGNQFSVAVSNSAGNAVSNPATLSVNVPYNFVVQVPSTTAAGSGIVTVTAQIGGVSQTAQMTLNVN